MNENIAKIVLLFYIIVIGVFVWGLFSSNVYLVIAPIVIFLIIFIVSKIIREKGNNDSSDKEKVIIEPIVVNEEKNNEPLTQETFDIVDDANKIIDNKNITEPDKTSHRNLSTTYDNFYLKYNYKQRICFINGSGIDASVCENHINDTIVFKQEPENEFDKSAIAIYLDDKRIGYVYRGQTQDMINNWIKKGRYFEGFICEYNATENKAWYKIGFYSLLDDFDTLTCKVSRFNSDCLVNIGDVIDFEFDFDKEKYILYDDFGEKLGTLPAATERKLEDVKINRIIVENFDNSGEKPVCIIKIYY